MTQIRLYTECPTPKKQRFATMEAARDVAKRASFELDKTLYPYDTCRCGWVHLTSKKGAVTPPTLTALASADNETFAQAVRDDVRGLAHADDRAALRHPENLMRWKRELSAFAKEVELQLAKAAGKRTPELDEWRHRIGVVRASISGTRQECTDRIEAYRVERAVARKAQAQERSIAGERAVKRLIEAHQLQFQRFLAEECEAQGVEIPLRIQRHIELAALASGTDQPEEETP